MDTKPTINQFRQAALSTQFVAALILWALAIVAWSIDDRVARIVGTVVGILAVSSLFFRKTLIDVEKQRVTEVYNFLNLIPVWSRQRDFQQFQGVQYYCSDPHLGGGNTGNEFTTWQVGLCPYSGRALDLRQFSGPFSGDCPDQVKAFAHELCGLTNLKLIERHSAIKCQKVMPPLPGRKKALIAAAFVVAYSLAIWVLIQNYSEFLSVVLFFSPVGVFYLVYARRLCPECHGRCIPRQRLVDDISVKSDYQYCPRCETAWLIPNRQTKR